MKNTIVQALNKVSHTSEVLIAEMRRMNIGTNTLRAIELEIKGQKEILSEISRQSTDTFQRETVEQETINQLILQIETNELEAKERETYWSKLLLKNKEKETNTVLEEMYSNAELKATKLENKVNELSREAEELKETLTTKNKDHETLQTAYNDIKSRFCDMTAMQYEKEELARKVYFEKEGRVKAEEMVQEMSDYISHHLIKAEPSNNFKLLDRNKDEIIRILNTRIEQLLKDKDVPSLPVEKYETNETITYFNNKIEILRNENNSIKQELETIRNENYNLRDKVSYLVKEKLALHQELETTKEKLASSLNCKFEPLETKDFKEKIDELTQKHQEQLGKWLDTEKELRITIQEQSEQEVRLKAIINNLKGMLSSANMRESHDELRAKYKELEYKHRLQRNDMAKLKKIINPLKEQVLMSNIDLDYHVRFIQSLSYQNFQLSSRIEPPSDEALRKIVSILHRLTKQ